MGIKITLEEVEDIRTRYWSPVLFGKVLEYEQSLLAEVEQRDGWLFNGMGRPMAIMEKKQKDVVNTMIQSTGHDMTDLLVLHTERLIHSRWLSAVPIIPDYHDETIWMCPEDQAQAVAQCMTDAVAQVNNDVQYAIELKGSPEITQDFTGFKAPDPVEWYSEKLKDKEKKNDKVKEKKSDVSIGDTAAPARTDQVSHSPPW
jgi:hypothetical protein